MKNEICMLIASALPEMNKQDIFEAIEIPPKSDMGDYSFPCFKLSKVLRKAPPVIAQEIKDKLKNVDGIDKIEVLGGYLNFYVDRKQYLKSIISKYKDSEDYGCSTEGNGKTICIDYSSPNVAKNFHVGHLRTTLIGNSIYKIYKKLGYDVQRINHLGDWGTQFGKLIVAYKKWGSKEAVEKNGVSELMNIYIRFHEEADKNPELNDEARAWFTQMEQGNAEALEIWKWFVDISLKEYMKTYSLLDIEFDSFCGESFYNDKMKAVVEELEKKGLLKLSEGAKIVELEEDGMPPCLITKKDGSTLYATRDIAAALYRKKTYNFVKCIYVTGQEQKLHFAQWFKVIEKMGYEWAKDLVHVPYGMVSLPEGKVSTRKGNIIFAEDILRQSIQKTREIIEQNANIENKDEVAEQVGVGAVIFNDLFNGKIKDVVFSWDKILNFDGETGPYVQYAHARANSVLRNANYTEPDYNIDYSSLDNEVTLTLIKQIANYSEVIKEAANKLEPSIVTRYVVGLAQSFSKFYNECHILVEDEEVKKARLLVVFITKNVIKNALSLLGIKAPEKM